MLKSRHWKVCLWVVAIGGLIWLLSTPALVIIHAYQQQEAGQRIISVTNEHSQKFLELWKQALAYNEQLKTLEPTLQSEMSLPQFPTHLQQANQSAGSQTPLPIFGADNLSGLESSTTPVTGVASAPPAGGQRIDSAGADWETYRKTLSIGENGELAVLIIPRLGLTIPVFHGSDQKVLARGVGHLWGTSLPLPGTTTHSVLAGHTGLPQMRIFDNLPRLRRGDEIQIWVGELKMVYRVFKHQIIAPTDLSTFSLVPQHNRLSLVTCYPPGLNTQRYVVQAELVPPVPSPLKKSTPQFLRTTTTVETPSARQLWISLPRWAQLRISLGGIILLSFIVVGVIAILPPREQNLAARKYLSPDSKTTRRVFSCSRRNLPHFDRRVGGGKTIDRSLPT